MAILFFIKLQFELKHFRNKISLQRYWFNALVFNQ